MRYYVCKVCSHYHRLRDTTEFKCRFCGSEQGRKLSKREWGGHAK